MARSNDIPEEKDNDLTLSWFYDDLPEEYRQVRKFVQVIEQEYLELRHLLKETQARLQTRETDVELEARAKYLQKRIAGLEKKYTWLISEQVLEYALWGVPH